MMGLGGLVSKDELRTDLLTCILDGTVGMPLAVAITIALSHAMQPEPVRHF